MSDSANLSLSLQHFPQLSITRAAMGCCRHPVNVLGLFDQLLIQTRIIILLSRIQINSLTTVKRSSSYVSSDI